MVGCHRTNTFLDARLNGKWNEIIQSHIGNVGDDQTNTYAARIRWYKQLCDFTSVYAKAMQQRTTVQIPQTDREINTAGQQM